MHSTAMGSTPRPTFGPPGPSRGAGTARRPRLSKARAILPFSSRRGLEAHRRLRAVAVAADVLLARPDQLDRLAHLPWRRRRPGSARRALPRRPKPPPTKLLWTIDLLRREAGRLGRRLQQPPSGAGWRSRRRARSGCSADRAVQRLHRRVGQVGRLVDRLDQLGAGLAEAPPAASPSFRAVAIGRPGASRVDLVELGAAAPCRVGAGRPTRSSARRARLLGAPVPVGDHGHGVRQLHHADDAADVPGRRCRRRSSSLPPETGHGSDRGVDHPRNAGRRCRTWPSRRAWARCPAAASTCRPGCTGPAS